MTSQAMAESRLELNLEPKRPLRSHWDKGYRDDWQRYAEDLLSRWIHRDKPTRSEFKCAIIGLRPIAESKHKNKQAREITNLHLELQSILKRLK